MSQEKNGRNQSLNDKPLIVLSAWEVVAPCAAEARRLLESAGCLVETYTADGAGGQAMEARIESGAVSGILELCLTELTDSLLRGAGSAGAYRLEAFAGRGIPMVLTPGGMELARYAADAIPVEYRRHRHLSLPPDQVVIRADVSDSARLGRLLAEKVNRATGPVAICLPLRGLSALDAPGEPFWSSETNITLFGNLTTLLRRDIAIYEGNIHINEPAFARMCVEILLGFLGRSL